MLDPLQLKRKLRKGAHGYLTIQIPKVMQQQLKWSAKGDVLLTLTQDGVFIQDIKPRKDNGKKVVCTDGRSVQVTDHHSESDGLVTS